jgi:RNA polymerase sigma-70 factor (ECF subfamily)
MQRGTNPAIARQAPAAESRRAEAGLVERAAAGDAVAFGELYAAHLDAIYRHLCFRVRDVEVAAELTQEVFLKAYRSLDSLRRPERFRAWLFRIAHHKALNHLRRHSESRIADRLLESQPAAGPEPEELASRQIEMDRVIEAAAGLTELQQQVLALRFISGLTVAETADIMDRKANAIRNLQHNALAALRRRLPEQGPSR